MATNNRLTAQLPMIEAAIADRQPDVAALSRKLDVDFTEHMRYRQLNLEVYSAGLINLAESDFVHQSLGSFPSDFNRQPLAVKVLLTECFYAWLKAVVRARQSVSA